MPWSVSQRDGKWCVIKEGESSPIPGGCHGSRTDAIKHQRALYANESRTAAMYAELDAQDYGWVEEKEEAPVPVELEDSLSPFAAQLVSLILKDEREKSLTASLAQSMDAISARMASEKEERTALVAALSAIGQPVINVETPEVTVHVPPAEVRVDVPAAEVTVNTPEVKVDVPAPQVTFSPEITLPASNVTKTVTFERDPLTGQVSSAEIRE